MNKQSKQKPRIGTLDIETAPIVAYVWSLWKVNVGLNQILCDWSILSLCYKWLDEKKPAYFDTAGQGASERTAGYGVRDDSKLLIALWEFLDEADIVIMQNGIAFDKRKINARFIAAGMRPPSPYKVVDTKVEAAKIAAFTSNKLEWLSRVLTDTPKYLHSEFPGMELWNECLKDNPRAWKVMRKYNPIDVCATEKVYLKLLPWIEGHPNVAAYDDDVEVRCPRCGSSEVVRNGSKTLSAGQYQQFLCKSCGGWSRSRYVKSAKVKRQSLLVA